MRILEAEVFDDPKKIAEADAPHPFVRLKMGSVFFDVDPATAKQLVATLSKIIPAEQPSV